MSAAMSGVLSEAPFTSPSPVFQMSGLRGEEHRAKPCYFYRCK